MAGFPGTGKIDEIGHNCEPRAAPVSLPSFLHAQHGARAAKKFSGKFLLFFRESRKT
jgi:hypothetical protein